MGSDHHTVLQLNLPAMTDTWKTAAEVHGTLRCSISAGKMGVLAGILLQLELWGDKDTRSGVARRSHAGSGPQGPAAG